MVKPILLGTCARFFFYKKKVYKKLRLKSSKSLKNRKKITKLNFQNQVFL